MGGAEKPGGAGIAGGVGGMEGKGLIEVGIYGDGLIEVGVVCKELSVDVCDRLGEGVLIDGCEGLLSFGARTVGVSAA